MYWKTFVVVQVVGLLNQICVWGYLAFTPQIEPEDEKLTKILIITYYTVCAVKTAADILLFLVTLKYVSKYANEFSAMKSAKKKFCFQLNKVIAFLIYLFGHILKNTLFEVRHIELLIAHPDGEANEKAVRGLVLAFLDNTLADLVYSLNLISQFCLGVATIAIIDYFGSHHGRAENRQKIENTDFDVESERNSQQKSSRPESRTIS